MPDPQPTMQDFKTRNPEVVKSACEAMRDGKTFSWGIGSKHYEGAVYRIERMRVSGSFKITILGF